MVVASAGESAAPSRRASPGAAGLVRAIAASLLVPLGLLAFTALVFWDDLTGGPIAYGRDTAVFYYPLTQWMAEALREGQLPVWMPLIYGGYPLLADGEVGPLYPPNILLLSLLPTPLAYGWLRAFHYAVAALGLYALVRTLGVGRSGGLIGGLSFAYGSFMVGHLEHDNIVRSAAWLPWLLVAAERALRAHGPTRVAWTLLGGLALALQSLGLHIQPVLLSLLVLGAYLLTGPLGTRLTARPAANLPPSPRERRGRGSAFPSAKGARGFGLQARALRLPKGRGWLRLTSVIPGRLRIGLGIVGLGLGLASAQLLPLYLLGQQSLRTSLVTYDYATSYAVAPPQLLTLLFPYMFHFDYERSWALWSPHESTLYAGIAPGVLALIALGFVRTRPVLFFGLVALASLVLCLGDYLPIKPYALIWSLPGFSMLRAPARFSLLFGLAIACLAALATDWLGRRARAGAAITLRDGEPTDTAGTRPLGAQRTLKLLLMTLAVAPLSLALLLHGLRWWLQHDPSPALELFRVTYLEANRENGLLGPWHVYYGILEFTRPDNFRTLLALALLGVVPLVLAGWLRRPEREIIWRGVLGALVALDLWFFATGFHPRMEPDLLGPPSPLVPYLASQPGPFRLFVEPSLNRSLGPNQLVTSGLATVNGYSSLEPRELSAYWWSVVMQDNFLLDLFNVRYVLAAPRTAGQRTYQGTRYHPSDRLLSGERGNWSGHAEFDVPPMQVGGLTVVSAVEGLEPVPAGTPLAELTLLGPRGERSVAMLRAEIDVGEYRAIEPGYPTAEYLGPSVAWAGPGFVPNGKGGPVRLYGATLPLSPSVEVSGLTIQTLSRGRLHVHGLGLRAPDGAVFSLKSTDQRKYRPLYEGWDTLLVENRLAWPRVWVVGGAVAAKPGTPIVDQLLGRRWDPTREILVEGIGPADLRQAEGSEPIGQAELVAYEPRRAIVQADLAAPGYLVLGDRYDDDWRAWSAGRELPVLRANAVQRAVSLPAGSHTVTFVYDPWSVRVGFILSGIAALAFVPTLAVALADATQRRAPGPTRAQ